MIYKLTLLLLFFSIIISVSFGQKKPIPVSNSLVSAKDFFLPPSGKNKIMLFTPDPSGKKTNDGRVIYYTLTETNIPPDTAKPKPPVKSGTAKAPAPVKSIPNYTLKYQITDMNMYGEQITGTEKQTVEVTNGEVKVLNSVFNNLLDKNKPIEYTPPLTLLKMPKTGQKAYWTFTDRTKRDYKCTAEWSGVVIDGQKKRAIMVTTEPSEENKRIGKTMSYYVEGYGLWKTEYVDPKGIKQIVDQFDKMDFDYALPGN